MGVKCVSVLDPVQGLNELLQLTDKVNKQQSTVKTIFWKKPAQLGLALAAIAVAIAALVREIFAAYGYVLLVIAKGVLHLVRLIARSPIGQKAYDILPGWQASIEKVKSIGAKILSIGASLIGAVCFWYRGSEWNVRAQTVLKNTSSGEKSDKKAPIHVKRTHKVATKVEKAETSRAETQTPPVLPAPFAPPTLPEAAPSGPRLPNPPLAASVLKAHPAAPSRKPTSQASQSPSLAPTGASSRQLPKAPTEKSERKLKRSSHPQNVAPAISNPPPPPPPPPMHQTPQSPRIQQPRVATSPEPVQSDVKSSPPQKTLQDEILQGKKLASVTSAPSIKQLAKKDGQSTVMFKLAKRQSMVNPSTSITLNTKESKAKLRGSRFFTDPEVLPILLFFKLTEVAEQFDDQDWDKNISDKLIELNGKVCPKSGQVLSLPTAPHVKIIIDSVRNDVIEEITLEKNPMK